MQVNYFTCSAANDGLASQTTELVTSAFGKTDVSEPDGPKPARRFCKLICQLLQRGIDRLNPHKSNKQCARRILPDLQLID